MTDLFRNADDLKASGYLFRITDNGGETYDRITVTFCDGDALVCTADSICAAVERVDVQRDADDVEAGTARDLRWIDLDEGLRRRIIASLNDSFRDYIDSEPAATSRDTARDWMGLWNEYDDDRSPIYRKGDSFYIRDDEMAGYNEDGEPGPFPTFRDAVFGMLPDAWQLAGHEYHSTVDLWDTEGGPRPLWDREAEPATPFEVCPIARGDTAPYLLPMIGEARDPEHAAEIGEAWVEANPELARDYQPAYINKVDRVIHRMD